MISQLNNIRLVFNDYLNLIKNKKKLRNLLMKNFLNLIKNIKKKYKKFCELLIKNLLIYK